MVNPGLKRFAVLQESRNRRASGVRPPAARDGFFRIGLIDTILRRHKSRSRSPPRCARIVGEGSKLMRPDFPFLCRRLAGLTCVLLLLTSSASATDVEGALAVAADQPQVTMVVRGSYSGNPFTADGNVGYIQAFLDTGCSGILLSQETASVALRRHARSVWPSSTYYEPRRPSKTSTGHVPRRWALAAASRPTSPRSSITAWAPTACGTSRPIWRRYNQTLSGRCECS